MDDKMSKDKLDYIFGKDSVGATEIDRARSSKQIYVRGQDHLSFWNKNAAGRSLTTYQAYVAFGINALQEVADHGSAIIVQSKEEPAKSLITQRKALGITVAQLSTKTGLSSEEIESCEDQTIRSPIRLIEKMAIALGLDETRISFQPTYGYEDRFAVRLKDLSHTQSLSASAVLALSEASWVIRTQDRLAHDLGQMPTLKDEFIPSDNYGTSGYPAWEHGYYLARKTREILGYKENEPIESLRVVCDDLGIPLLHAKLSSLHAGATIVSHNVRGIVVNTEGRNKNVWIQRATVAHELGHLLWDPDEKLKRVRVDTYDELENLYINRDTKDFVEARANAFAIAFLAPLAAVKTEFLRHTDSKIGVRSVMEKFGISYTAAKYQIWNATERECVLTELNVKDVEPTDEWVGREAYTDDFFPIDSTEIIRRGKFCGLVVKSEMKKLITEDTASTYLQSDVLTYREKRQLIHDLFN